jgi:hypothetical protein
MDVARVGRDGHGAVLIAGDKDTSAVTAGGDRVSPIHALHAIQAILLHPLAGQRPARGIALKDGQGVALPAGRIDADAVGAGRQRLDLPQPLHAGIAVPHHSFDEDPTPTADLPGFVAEEPERCRNCYRLIRPGQGYFLTIEQAYLYLA